jgi:hypothetical protein
MDNFPTSRNVIFSFRRIKKIVCSWRNSGTSSAAAYSPRILLRRVNRSSPWGLAHFCILNTVSSTSAGGAAMTDAVRHQLGDQKEQEIQLAAGQVTAPLGDPPACLARGMRGHGQFDVLVLLFLRNRPRYPHRATLSTRGGKPPACNSLNISYPPYPDGIAIFPNSVEASPGVGGQVVPRGAIRRMRCSWTSASCVPSSGPI